MTLLDWLISDDFAARADGSCTGWTVDLAAWSTAAHVLIWIAYVAIPVAILRWRLMVTHRIAILFAAFIFTCGTGHLIAAITNYRPMYNLAVTWDFVIAWASLTTAWFAFRTARCYRIVERAEWEDLRGRLAVAESKARRIAP